jgi:hypothetical protein
MGVSASQAMRGTLKWSVSLKHEPSCWHSVFYAKGKSGPNSADRFYRCPNLVDGYVGHTGEVTDGTAISTMACAGSALEINFDGWVGVGPEPIIAVGWTKYGDGVNARCCRQVGESGVASDRDPALSNGIESLLETGFSNDLHLGPHRPGQLFQERAVIATAHSDHGACPALGQHYKAFDWPALGRMGRGWEQQQSIAICGWKPRPGCSCYSSGCCIAVDHRGGRVPF